MFEDCDNYIYPLRPWKWTGRGEVAVTARVCCLYLYLPACCSKPKSSQSLNVNLHETSYPSWRPWSRNSWFFGLFFSPPSNRGNCTTYCLGCSWCLSKPPMKQQEEGAQLATTLAIEVPSWSWGNTIWLLVIILVFLGIRRAMFRGVDILIGRLGKRRPISTSHVHCDLFIAPWLIYMPGEEKSTKRPSSVSLSHHLALLPPPKVLQTTGAPQPRAAAHLPISGVRAVARINLRSFRCKV